MTSLIYNTGTVSVSAGSAVVTGNMTGWAVALVTGGLFSCAGVSIPIASVESDTSLTLAYPWTGADATGAAYAIARDTSEATRAAWTNDRLATIIQRLSLVGIHPDGSGTIAERDALDPVPAVGYLWLYAEAGNDFAFYRKTASGWEGPFEVRGGVGGTGGSGPAATIAVGDVTTVAPGDPATVTNSGTSSAAVFDFEIPQGDAASINIVAGEGILVDAVDPANPVVSVVPVAISKTDPIPTPTAGRVGLLKPSTPIFADGEIWRMFDGQPADFLSWVPRDDDGQPFLFVFDPEHNRGYFNGVEYGSTAAFLAAVNGVDNGNGTYTIGTAASVFDGYDFTKGTIVDKYELTSVPINRFAWSIQVSGTANDYIRSLVTNGTGQTTFDVVRAGTAQASVWTPDTAKIGVHTNCYSYALNEFTHHQDGEEISRPDLSGILPDAKSSTLLMIGHRNGTMLLPGSYKFWAYTPKTVSRSKRRVLSGGLPELVPGAWTWWNEDQAITLGNGTAIVGAVSWDGSILVSTLSGPPVVLHAQLELDDHDNPGMVRLPDGRILAQYCEHSKAKFYQRISVNPDDISTWGPEIELSGQFGITNYSYARPILMDSGAIYTFFRGNDGTYERTWHYSKSIDNGATWSPAVQILDGITGARPYIHLVKNGATRIDCVTSTGHPNEVVNCSLYHFYMDTSDDTFYATDGTSLGAAPFGPAEATLVWDGSTAAGEGWSWDIRIGGDGLPVIVFAAFVTTTDHRYHRATTDGATWTATEICTAGGYNYSGPDQVYYSGGICLDPADTNTVYCSRGDVNNTFNVWKGTTGDGGATWTMTQVTNSREDRFRPYLVAGTNKLVFLAGQYLTYTSYFTRVLSVDAI